MPVCEHELKGIMFLQTKQLDFCFATYLTCVVLSSYSVCFFSVSKR